MTTQDMTQSEIVSLRQRVAELEQELSICRLALATIGQQGIQQNKQNTLPQETHTHAAPMGNIGYDEDKTYPKKILDAPIDDEMQQCVDERTFTLQQAVARLLNELTKHQKIHGELNEAYRTLVDHSLQGLIIRQGKPYVFANSMMSHITGYTVDELLAMSPQEIETIVYPADRDMVVTYYQRRMQDEDVPNRYEHRIIRKDSTVRWLETYVTRTTYQGQPAVQAAYIDVTERKQVEQALRQKEANLESAQRIARVGNWEWDIPTGTLTWSDEVYRIFGLAPQEVEATYEMFLQIVHPNDRMAVEQAVAWALEHHKPYKLHHRIVRPNGEERIVHEQGEVYYDAQDNPIRMIGVVQDVTERMRAEEEVRQFNITLEQRVAERTAELHYNQTLLQGILDAIPAIVYVNDKEGRYLLVNMYAAVRQHKSPEWFIGKTADVVFPPDVVESQSEDEAYVMRTGKPIEREVTLTLGDTTHTFHCIRFPLFNERGDVYAMGNISTDITERKRMEETLREQSKRLAKAERIAHLGSWEMDIATGQSTWSDEFFRICGFEPGAFEPTAELGMQLIHPDDRERAAKHISHAIEQQEPYRIEKRIVHPDGSVRWVYSVGEVTFDSTNQAGELTGAFLDITERKEIEIELHRARDAAEAADHAKSEFLANMSHEIRTPMNAVIGMTNLMLDTELTPEQRDYVQTIRVSGETLLTIINDILDFSKIEAGRLEIEHHTFNVRACIEEALELVSSRAAEKELNLVYWIDENTPEDLIGDVTRVRQILVNLLSNAVKFTDKGEVMVKVSAVLAEGPVNQRSNGSSHDTTTKPYIYHFSVRDTGIGITADHLGRLFQPFTQVDASTTRKYGGTGLGLAISRWLAEMMGGTLWAESVLGEGSTFHVTLAMEVSEPQSFFDYRDDKHILTGKRVLIVDDNITNCRILSHYVENWGMIPTVTCSGQKALDAVRQHPTFDIAILDMHMPDMDGLTLAENIHNDLPEHDFPMILWTSVTVRGEMAKQMNTNIAVLLVKPIRPAALYDALVTIFKGSSPVIKTIMHGSHFDHNMATRNPLRLLLAEDNSVNQKVALLMLEKLGYRADLASNGIEVLHLLELQTYDAILMDVQMPEMDGIEATKNVRENWSIMQQPRIIAMTAHALEGNREWLLDSGMDDYVSKPIRLEELVAALERTKPKQRTTMFDTVPTQPASAFDQIPTAPEPEPEPEPPTYPSLDQTVLKRFRDMMGAEKATGLINLFLQDASKLLTNMQQALEQNKVEDFTRFAHSLKSSSAQIGALRLSEQCKQMEMLGRNGTLEQVPALIKQAQAEYTQVQEALG